MYNKNQFLAPSAKTALENNQREQDSRRQSMLRTQKMQELQKLETQLFYKKQEILRLKTLNERLSREAVVKQNTEIKEKNELAAQKRQLTDTQTRIKELDEMITRSLSEIGEKIKKEKTIISEHERVLDSLESEKRQIETKEVVKERSLKESLSRILFFKKKEENEERHAKELFRSNQQYLHQTQQAFKSFSQEATVLENKIRALRGALK